jgi:hypothetical protein|tara:strand:+ start:1684 stop:2265 length:582 start_codon:yes stop_codon:yes gene_type:complete
METTVYVTTSDSWWSMPIAWFTLLFPIILASFVLVGLIVLHKRANRSLGKKPISANKLLMESFCLGMLIGGLFQYLLHDIVIAISGLTFNDDLLSKLVILSAILTGPLGHMFYHLSRWWAKSRNHKGLYQFLSVKHNPKIDYTDDDVSDMTEATWTKVPKETQYTQKVEREPVKPRESMIRKYSQGHDDDWDR